VLKPLNSIRWYKEVIEWLDRWAKGWRSVRAPRGSSGEAIDSAATSAVRDGAGRLAARRAADV